MLPNVVRRRTNSLPNFVDEFFNDGFLTGFLTPDHNWQNNWTPAVNVEETEKDYRIEVAAPGLEKNDIKVSVNDGVLSVAYEKKTEKEEKKDSYLRREFGYSSFSRSGITPYPDLPRNCVAGAIRRIISPFRGACPGAQTEEFKCPIPRSPRNGRRRAAS